MNGGSDVLVGASAAIRQLDEDISAAARSDAKVLILGESGVGKEVAATLLHRRSRRDRGTLVSLNCAGVPDTLLESELFGHLRGSFTGAERDRPGLLEAAHGGTVFLDEIGEMTLRMQALLLRFLETGEIQRVGANHAVRRLDVRVISATNRDLTERTASGEFRTDLFYRLNVIQLSIPPLRERRDDIAPLLAHFLRHYAAADRRAVPQLSEAALDELRAHDWPGNVRELRNVAEQLGARAPGAIIEPHDLPLTLRKPRLPVAVVPDPVAALPDEIFDRLVRQGQSFWPVVHAPFIAHDMTRDTLRQVIARGLALTNGRYSGLTTLFNMPPRDYKRLLAFLRKHDCLVPYQPFRRQPASGAAPARETRVA